MIRPILSLIVLLAMSVPAVAQFGSPGQRGSTGPFGPSPQQQGPYGAPQRPPHPQHPHYPQQPYPTQVQVSLVGVWSTTLYDTQGRAFASIFIQFAPDGRYHKRMLVPAGQTDVFGVWQYDAQNSILHSKAQDYSPRNIPPSEPMGQLYSLQLQWASSNMFLTQDVSGPVRWVRQQ